MMHSYIVKLGDVVSTKLHANGCLHTYIVLQNELPANGWSNKIYFENKQLQTEENYSNGMLIEKVSYNETGDIIAHKIWNNRLKQLIDKPLPPPFVRHNIVSGCTSIYYYLQQMPAISKFIGVYYDKNLLIQSHDKFMDTGAENTEWRLEGKQMSFTIYWQTGEVFHQWHCHCKTEELYCKAKIFFAAIF
jgi:hypothetical protein